MAQWHEVSGSSPTKVRTAFKVFRHHNFKTRQGVEGTSFYVLVPEQNTPFFQTLMKEFDLRVKGVTKESLAMVEANSIKGGEMDKETTSVAPVKSKRARHEKPPEEQLLGLRRRHTLKQIGQMFGTTQHTVRDWLKNIPEAKSIQTTYTCPETGCGRKFTGPKARWQYAAHLKNDHKYSHKKPAKVLKAKAVPVDITREVPTEVLPLKEKIASFDKEIAGLEAEKTKLTEKLDQQIATVKTAREEYINSILAILTGEGR